MTNALARKKRRFRFGVAAIFLTLAVFATAVIADAFWSGRSPLQADREFLKKGATVFSEPSFAEQQANLAFRESFLTSATEIAETAETSEPASKTSSTTNDDAERNVEIVENLRETPQIELSVSLATAPAAPFSASRLETDWTLANRPENRVQVRKPAFSATKDASAPFLFTDEFLPNDENSVGAAVVKTRTTPVLARFCDLKSVERWKEWAESSSKGNLLIAPKITCFSGQVATVADVASNLYVDSAVFVVGKYASAWQPVVSTAPTGIEIQTRARVVDGDSIRLDLRCVSQRVEEPSSSVVLTAGWSKNLNGGADALSLQCPEIETTTFRVDSIVVPKGMSLLLAVPQGRCENLALKEEKREDCGTFYVLVSCEILETTNGAAAEENAVAVR